LKLPARKTAIGSIRRDRGAAGDGTADFSVLQNELKGRSSSIVPASARIGAVPHLRYHALQTELTGIREYLAPLDLAALAELDVGASHDLQFGLNAKTVEWGYWSLWST
jgi:hypothetical protein